MKKIFDNVIQHGWLHIKMPIAVISFLIITIRTFLKHTFQMPSLENPSTK